MKTIAQLPKLKGLPLIGSILEYRRDFLGLLSHVAEQGDMSKFTIMGQELVMINSPEMLQELLITNGHKLNKSDDFMDALGPLGGHGLFTIEEKLHKEDRKLLAPDFTPRSVEPFGGMIVDCVDDQLAEWKDGEEVLIGKAMVQLTVRIIGKISLGVDLLQESEALWQTFTVAFEEMRAYMAEFLPIPLSFPTPSHRAYLNAVADLDKLIYRIIDEHKRGDNKSEDVINRLLRLQDQDTGGQIEVSDKQIRDEVVTVLLAGHETTANSLAFLWGSLACEPEVYQKAIDQVDEVLQGRAPTPADLKSLPYIGQIFHESLRKYPPLYVLDRQTLEPIVVGDCELPKGTVILFSPYTLHRRLETFPDPETFDPERFSAENAPKIPKMGFLPFSAGHRICLGKSLAIMEASLILIRSMQKMRFEPVNGQLPHAEPQATLRADPKYRLRVVRR